MRAVDLILKKRAGGEHDREEIAWLVQGFSDGSIADYQIAAWLMAVCFQGLSPDETAFLTRAMTDSGDVLDLSRVEGLTVDKHSTGGVGDKTTLVLAPLVACFDLKVAKMSGRGLGHTGGTLDKLDSVPGFVSALDEDAFYRAVNRSGVAVAAQTADLVPADKKLYALRDVTGTVDQIGLIAASIMSKKLAVVNDALVLDVKVGSGAFMKTEKAARELAKAMVEIGVREGRRLAAVLSDMEEPLGSAIGNALEVEEASRTLEGRGPGDLTELVARLSAELLRLTGRAKDGDEGYRLCMEALRSGEAHRRFVAFLEAQGAEKGALSRLPRAPSTFELGAPEDGFVAGLDALEIGIAAMELGAGRATKDDAIDPGVGLELLKKRGDRVKKGEPMVRFHHHRERGLAGAVARVAKAYRIAARKPKARPLVLGVVDGAGLDR